MARRPRHQGVQVYKAVVSVADVAKLVEFIYDNVNKLPADELLKRAYDVINEGRVGRRPDWSKGKPAKRAKKVKAAALRLPMSHTSSASHDSRVGQSYAARIKPGTTEMVSVPPVPNPHQKGTPDHEAVERARKRWGRRGYAITFYEKDDTRRFVQVGEVINDELVVYGQGKTFDEAFDNATRKP